MYVPFSLSLCFLYHITVLLFSSQRRKKTKTKKYHSWRGKENETRNVPQLCYFLRFSGNQKHTSEFKTDTNFLAFWGITSLVSVLFVRLEKGNPSKIMQTKQEKKRKSHLIFLYFLSTKNQKELHFCIGKLIPIY